MIDQYRGAFDSFVKNRTLGPFAKQTELSPEQVQEELQLNQEARDRYEALDQQSGDRNPAPGQVTVPRDTAWPPAPLTKEQQESADRLKAGFEAAGLSPVTAEDRMLEVSLSDNQVAVEETGLNPGVSFTRVVGDDTYYMNVSFDRETDIVQATHVNSASGTGVLQTLQYVVSEDDQGSTPAQEFVTMTVTEDENGVLRLGEG